MEGALGFGKYINNNENVWAWDCGVLWICHGGGKEILYLGMCMCVCVLNWLDICSLDIFIFVRFLFGGERGVWLSFVVVVVRTRGFGEGVWARIEDVGEVIKEEGMK